MEEQKIPSIEKEKKDSQEKSKKHPKPVKKPTEPQIPESVTRHLDEIMRRLRLLEERYSGLRKKTQFTEQNMLKDAKELNQEISTLHETISELKNEISELAEKLEKISEEINTSVSKPEFNVLSRYVDFWQPMNFLTRKEAEKIIAEFKK